MAEASLPPIGELQDRLAGAGDPARRAWWEGYLKGQAPFRGVSTPEVRQAAMAWWDGHATDSLDAERQLDTCLRLLRAPWTEDKTAGMLILGERLIPAGRVDHDMALPRFASLYVDSDLADWNAVDWFCVRVLGPLIRHAGTPCAESVATWVTSEVLWQRRSALVAFVTVAPSGQHADLIVHIAEQLVRDEARFAQTAVAWTIRELGQARPDLTGPFLERHVDDMSEEARRQVSGRRRRRT